MCVCVCLCGMQQKCWNHPPPPVVCFSNHYVLEFCSYLHFSIVVFFPPYCACSRSRRRDDLMGPVWWVSTLPPGVVCFLTAHIHTLTQRLTYAHTHTHTRARASACRVKVAVIAEFYKRFRIFICPVIFFSPSVPLTVALAFSLTISGFSLFHTCSNKWLHMRECVCAWLYVFLPVCVRTSFTSQIVSSLAFVRRYFHFLIVRACPKKTEMTQSPWRIDFDSFAGHLHLYPNINAEEGVAPIEIEFFHSEFELFKRAYANGNLCRCVLYTFCCCF